MAELQGHAKLVSVTRRDLPAGAQAVQSSHALISFIFDFPNKASPWFKESNYLIQKSVEDELELKYLAEQCRNMGLEVSEFREPDIGNELTAIAIEPSSTTNKLVRKLPLLFSLK